MSRFSEVVQSPPFQFSGQLIDGKTAASWLLARVCSAPSGVSLCSAFLRSEAIRTLYPSEKSKQEGRVLTRWRLDDLLSGASDLDAYPLSKRLGFAFYIRQDFHGKVFSIPLSGVIVGSANATLSGFGLQESANSEVCTLVPHSESNQALLDEIFYGAVEITDALFKEISSAVRSATINTTERLDWPNELLDRLQNPEFSGRLLLSECFVSRPVIDEMGVLLSAHERDLRLLGIRGVNLNADTLRNAFKTTRAFRWLLHALKSSGGELYFGSLTECLHRTLMDDPVPYRRDVKVVLQTLLHWCHLIKGVGVVVDRPNHSQRVRLG
jgi:hypothetical protein